MTIFQSAERLKISMSLPSKEILMFLEGTPYQTGSDYTPEQLAMPVQDIFETCGNCDGKGWSIYNISPEGEKDICHICWGTGNLSKLDE